MRIFIIEDHPVTVAGLRTYFRPSRDPESITESVENIEHALQINADSFDVILLDLWLPEGDPVDNFKKLATKFPAKPIIIFTAEQSLHWQRKLYKAGAKGYLNKQAGKLLIQDTLERVMKGEIVYSNLMSEYQVKRIILGYKDPKFGLTTEQKEIIALFIEGMPSKIIAIKIGKDISTINRLLREIRKIFDVSNNIDLLKTLLNIDELSEMDSGL